MDDAASYHNDTGSVDSSDKRIADLLAALAFDTFETLTWKDAAMNKIQPAKWDPSSPSSSSCSQEPVDALQEKLTKTQKQLRWVMSEKKEIEERFVQQQEEMESLIVECEVHKVREQQAKHTIASLEQQIATLRQQQSRAPSVFTAEHKEDEDEDDEDGDDHQALRDQIAAVKATLEQGSQQVKVKQESLNQELETFDRLRQKLADRKGVHAAARTPPASAVTTRETTINRPCMRDEGKVNQDSIFEELETCRRLLQKLAKKAQTATGTVPAGLGNTAGSLQEETQDFSEQVASLVASVLDGHDSLYQAEIEQWKKALLELSNYEES